MRPPLSLDRASVRRLNLKILAAAICVCLLCGAISLLDPLELLGQAMRCKARRHPPTGDLVVAAIDDKSLRELGQNPWPKNRIGDIVARLHVAGARQIAVDTPYWGDISPHEYARLEEALSGSNGTAILSAPLTTDPITQKQRLNFPPDSLRPWARIANTNFSRSWDGRIHKAPYSTAFEGTTLPSLASVMTGQGGNSEDQFPIDCAVNLRALTVLSAGDILQGRWKPSIVAGKDVIIGEASSLSQLYGVTGYGMVPTSFIHAAAIETLKGGRPVNAGWLAISLLALMLGAVFLLHPKRYIARSALAAGFGGLMFGPLALDSMHIFVIVTPALTLLMTVTIGHLWFNFKRTVRTRGTTNPVSGLPNLNALREGAQAPAEIVVVARILNFAEVATALPPHCEKDLVEQIVNRLGMGTNGSPIHQADDGLFIWLLEGAVDDRLDEQLMALHALFRSPVIVADRLIDLSVSFGIDSDKSRSLVQRVSSALVAADRAASEGRRWMTYDPAELEDAEWKMSLLARLDQAMEQGEIWVAYQPKIELATGRIIGAEALARWRHPEKGDIPPVQFIPAAERGGRIENLTAYVLDRAVEAAAILERSGQPGFSMSVNLSARLLDGSGVLPMVEDALARHRLLPGQLILEVTETTAMASQDSVITTLQALSAAGVRLSIDDYGTGFSTLDYLKRIPADEIKIDRSFISMLEKSQSDRIMVHSTIQLAHSLGRKAVAEGVENSNVLNELRLMQCDYIQGYLTGKPMSLRDLMGELADKGSERAA